MVVVTKYNNYEWMINVGYQKCDSSQSMTVYDKLMQDYVKGRKRQWTTSERKKSMWLILLLSSGFEIWYISY